jgi:hypothetical protein
MVMIGQRRPFDPNAPQYMPQVAIGGTPIVAPPLAADTLPTYAPKPGFFGQGGAGRGIAGAIGDYLLQMNHMQPIYAPARAEQSAFDRGEQQWQKHHQTDVADQMRLLDYKRANPDDELSQRLNQAGITDPTERASYARKLLERSTTDDPIVTLTLPGDHIYSGPRSGLATALTGAAPASPLSDNVPTVTNSAGYDALPPGARFKSPDGHIRVKGGQTPPASGNFSR